MQTEENNMVRDYLKEMADLYKKSLGEKQDYSGIVCPTTFKKPCRLCELCKEILFDKQNYPKEHPIRAKASSMNAKQHYYSNVLFLANPTEIVVFEYGDKVFKQLLALQMDETQPWQNFWHPAEGRWLVVERIQGATREQVDYYVKPRDVTKLPDMGVLAKLAEDKYNLTNIVDNVKAGTVKPVYQSKLDKLTTLRVLPSWLGPDYAFKFFEKVDFHYNISEDDFRATLAGEINPIRSTVTTQKPAVTQVNVDKPSANSSSWGDYATPKKEEKKPEPAVLPVTNAETGKLEEEQTGFDDDEFPVCYGDFDPKETSCSPKKCPDWLEGCKKYTQEKMDKRRTARRLNK
jgi:hypothetical protein